LLHFDIGRVYGGLVGESESNLREVVSVATACAPVVLRIDEIEKGLGGEDRDGGTSQRVLATLLTWLEEKPDNIFVVATANDVRKLQRMPELIQRFSNVFFVDLPNEEARVEILKIHLRLTNHEVPDYELRTVAQKTYGYSGRELRNLINAVLGESFTLDLKNPTSYQFENALKLITPTYKSMRESIESLRDWCKDGRARPAGALLESNKLETCEHKPVDLLN